MIARPSKFEASLLFLVVSRFHAPRVSPRSQCLRGENGFRHFYHHGAGTEDTENALRQISNQDATLFLLAVARKFFVEPEPENVN